MFVIGGIDPGKSGGVAIIGAGEPRVFSMEVAQLRDLQACTHVYVEKAQAYPKQGVSSVFAYGTGFGRLIGWLEALQVPYTLVTPREWQKLMWLGTDTKLETKERSLQAVKRLFPGG